MPSLTDLRELKKILEIPDTDTSEDVKLNFLIEMASVWIEEYLDRPLFYRTRTEYYRGSGRKKLLLRARPVFTTPPIEVYVDESGLYGSADDAFNAADTGKVYGEDFALQIDQPDGSSRSGILLYTNGYWPMPGVRSQGMLSPYLGDSVGNVKVIYTAGFTIDALPAKLRLACITLIARLRHFFPLGLELNSESYEERSISWAADRKDYLLALVKPLLHTYRNWRFG